MSRPRDARGPKRVTRATAVTRATVVRAGA